MTVLYSDVNQYEPHRRDILYDVQSVYQSLHNLFTIENGEVLFDLSGWPSFRSDLHKLMSDVTAFSILNKVINAVKIREPRVNLIENQCDVVVDADNREYKVDLVFELIGLTDGEFEFKGILPHASKGKY